MLTPDWPEDLSYVNHLLSWQAYLESVRAFALAELAFLQSRIGRDHSQWPG